MAEPRGGPTAAADGDGPNPSPQRRIVLVDDDHDVREFVRLTLELDGRLRVVGTTGSGRKAVALLAALQPDVALLDLRIPDLGGTELLEAAGAVAPACTLVVFTGVSDAHTAQAVRRAGGAGMLVKGASTARQLTEALVAFAATADPLDLREGA